MFQATCPICEKPMAVEQIADWPAFPFCSVKCRTIDLGRWLDKRYALEAPPSEEELDALTEQEG